MDGEELYRVFKEALHAFKLSWANKNKMKIYNTVGGLRFDYEDRVYFVKIKGMSEYKKEDEPKQ